MEEADILRGDFLTIISSDHKNEIPFLLNHVHGYWKWFAEINPPAIRSYHTDQLKRNQWTNVQIIIYWYKEKSFLGTHYTYYHKRELTSPYMYNFFGQTQSCLIILQICTYNIYYLLQYHNWLFFYIFILFYPSEWQLYKLGLLSSI